MSYQKSPPAVQFELPSSLLNLRLYTLVIADLISAAVHSSALNYNHSPAHLFNTAAFTCCPSFISMSSLIAKDQPSRH